MDKYVKVKQIGEGSFGKALLVKSKDNGKQFVVKEINMAKMAKKERDEARKETAVLAQLNHPNIVTYRESFEEIGNLYIVMDYCEGGDLYGKINAQRGILFHEDQVLDWFVQICLSIKHIHDRKILHRDIKSQNIFLTKHGIVKLGDFGIAKVLNSTVELARTCIGTPYYLSPEICENKPYNNKSDIWSLGCVLYELTTLKHAFEAGNMKNLVLKIIRGSFPPVSPKYSYEVRSLINHLFKRNPRDRPSISAVLRKPVLQARIKKFLSEREVADEFSHTVLHGQKIKKALPAGRPNLAPKPQAAKKPPSTPRYDPASVYGVSVARSSRDKDNKARRSSDARKSGDGANRRPGSAGGAAGNVDLVRKRQELQEKERQRREAAKKRQEQDVNKAHNDLLEKQKQARLNRAREDGWRNLFDPDDRKPSPVVVREEPKRPTPAPTPVPNFKPAAVPQNNTPFQDRGNFEQYHAWLDRLEKERRGNLGVVGGAPLAGANVAPPGFNPASAARQGEVARANAAAASERAKILNEFQQRKKEAEFYRNRGAGGVAAALGVPRPSPSADSVARKPPSGNAGVANRPQSAREAQAQKQEQEYLNRLKQIRLQNFNERRNHKDKPNVADPKYKPPGVNAKNDAEARKKKIEALRAQADERANRIKSELERKRKESRDLEERMKKAQDARVPAKRAVQEELPKPMPVLPMTEAMKAIGAAQQSPADERPVIGMTAAMAAIGAKSEEETTSKEQQKKDILKRLNSKSPKGSSEDVSGARPKWKEGEKVGLGQMPLEATGSNMEATNANDQVLLHKNESAPKQDDKSNAAPTSRKQWGGPADTAKKFLAEAPAEDDTSLPSARKQWGSPANTALDIFAKAAIMSDTSSFASSGVVSLNQRESPVPPRESPIPPRESPIPPRESPIPPRESPVPPKESPVPPKESTSDSAAAAAPADAAAAAAAKSVSEVASEADTKHQAPAIGSTFKIIKNPHGKGTIIIKNSTESQPEEEKTGDPKSDESKGADATDAKEVNTEKEANSDENKLEDGSKEEGKEEEEFDLAKELDKKKKELQEFEAKSKLSLFERVSFDEDEEEIKDGGMKLEDFESMDFENVEMKEKEDKECLEKNKEENKVEQKEENSEKEERKDETEEKNKDASEDTKTEDRKAIEQESEEKKEENKEEGCEELKEETGNKEETAAADDAQNKKDGLALGLTSGVFDVGNVLLLRTCSEPDFSRLFRNQNEAQMELFERQFSSSATMNPLVVDEVLEEQGDDEEEEDIANQNGNEETVDRKEVSGEEDNSKGENEKEDGEGKTEKVKESEVSEDEVGKEEEEVGKEDKKEKENGSKEEEGKEEKEDDDEEDSQEVTDDTQSSDKSSEPQEEEEGEETEEQADDEDDEDLKTLRQSYMNILEKGEEEEDLEHTVVPKKKKKGLGILKKKAKKKKMKMKVPEDMTDSIFTRQMSGSGSEEDLRSITETMKNILADKKEHKKKKLEKSPEMAEAGDPGSTELERSKGEKKSPEAGDGKEDQANTTLDPETETWQSDSDEDDDSSEFFEETNDVFARLEATRARLETALGFDTFLEAYKTVQAIHEDEDGNMEEGIQQITEILGEENVHLYPSILQLVMADGAYTEDND